MLCFAFLITIFAETNVIAAEKGATMSNPISVTWGKWYKKSWHGSNDKLNCYNVINVKKTGYITIRVTKPYDDEGEYGQLNIALFKKSGDEVFTTNTRESVNDGKSYYEYKVALSKGKYIINIKPGFKVISGDIDISYRVKFKAKKYVITQPRTRNSKKIKLGKKYIGWYGAAYDSDSNSGELYIKFKLKKGKKYKITINSNSNMGTTIIRLHKPNGEEYWPFDDAQIANNVKAKKTGTYYLYFYNYSSKQYKYNLKITKVK
jgi:hypothetical protein